MNKWIDILTEREERDTPLLWSWDMTGNMLELSVPAGIKNEITKYRQSVLQVGKIIQRIRNTYPDSGESLSVQLFPNLMDIGLVAVVRAPESNKLKKIDLPKNGKAIQFEDLLEKGKKEFSLDVDKIESKTTELVEDETDSDSLQTFVLSSAVSNPFVWVRTGYFLELIQNFHSDKLTGKVLKTVENIDKPTKQQVISELKKNIIPQALILIQK